MDDLTEREVRAASNSDDPKDTTLVRTGAALRRRARIEPSGADFDEVQIPGVENGAVAIDYAGEGVRLIVGRGDDPRIIELDEGDTDSPAIQLSFEEV